MRVSPLSRIAVPSILFILLCGVFLYITSREHGSSDIPRYLVSLDSMPHVSAEAWYVFDVETGEVVREYNSDVVLPIASVTKLMTAYTAEKYLPPDYVVSVSSRAVETEGSAGRLSVGEELSVHELLFPLLLESSNDAGVVLGSIKDDTFVSSMNSAALYMGMEHTVFVDPSGLAAGNISTAHDLSLLLRELFEHERHILDITMLKSYVGTNHDWLNNNPVVHEWGYKGGKHGYTEEAGRTFAGIFSERLRGGDERTIGMVILNSDDLKADVDALRMFLREHVAYAHMF